MLKRQSAMGLGWLDVEVVFLFRTCSDVALLISIRQPLSKINTLDCVPVATEYGVQLLDVLKLNHPSIF